jgi:hypothetical protein
LSLEISQNSRLWAKGWAKANLPSVRSHRWQRFGFRARAGGQGRQRFDGRGQIIICRLDTLSLNSSVCTHDITVVLGAAGRRLACGIEASLEPTGQEIYLSKDFWSAEALSRLVRWLGTGLAFRDPKTVPADHLKRFSQGRSLGKGE